ncbi:MAG TPA: hypothetical protein VFQ19_02650 [Nocardioidaceae bacterium]|jgi:hypothetical protein|nr:hypothetical protein [Nocardioidaceae bacterium]
MSVITAPPVRSLVPALARQEAGRLLRHPLVLFGFGLWVWNAGLAIVDDGGPREAFQTVDSMLSFFPGIFLILAANLVATRDGRAGSRELLTPAPGRLEERVKALLLASLAPTLLGLVLVSVLHGYFLLDGRYEVAPTFWHLLQGPVTLFGACALGIMLAEWLPARGTAVIAMVAMVLLNAWLGGLEDGMLFGPLMTWPIWGVLADDWAGLFPGDAWGHVVYLVGLCGMAATAALVRASDRPRPVVVVGLLTVVVAVAGGLAQLP